MRRRMFSLEDEDGIDGPWERAMDRADDEIDNRDESRDARDNELDERGDD